MARTYSITLTPEDRKAIDWVGYRYAHGDDLYKVLADCQAEPDSDPANPDNDSWDSKVNVTYTIPEHHAWTIRDIIELDNLACFAECLTSKLWEFYYGIL